MAKVKRAFILAHKDKGALKGSFKAGAAWDGSNCPDWYWSSTELREDLSRVWGVRFSYGFEDWQLKDIDRLSCRPVRLVAVI